MTNEMIVLNEAVRLMEEGVIGTTGRTITVKTIVDGEEVEKELQEPEPIHTYAGWKERGYQVQKGEHAVAQFTIWKHAVKKAKTEDEEDEQRMFMKRASWFKFSQVVPIEQ